MIVGKKSNTRVLVVDDASRGRSMLERRLGEQGYVVEAASSSVDALERIADRSPDAVIVNLEAPNLDGVQLIKQIRERDDALPLLAVVSPRAHHSAAADAIRAGAEEYVATPVDFAALALLIERVRERRAVRVENENLHRQLDERAEQGMEGLIGASPPMQRVYRMARQVAKSRATVLVTGESGTGKGELARAIHALGPRADKPFVSYRCAAKEESRLESELFGHDAGILPDASRVQVGCFERADGGTLFLREVGELPMPVQAKLLRVIRERTIRRRGAREPMAVDIRLVASTSGDLSVEVRKRRFRADLYYSLSVVQIEMPPLRNRGGDVLVLAHHFLRRLIRESHEPLEGFTDAARAKIMSHPWPGNVRALASAVEFAASVCDGPLIDAGDLPFDPVSEVLGTIRIPGSTLAELERHAILKTLEATGGSTAKAAELLDISVRTIQYRLHQYHVRAKDVRSGRERAR